MHKGIAFTVSPTVAVLARRPPTTPAAPPTGFAKKTAAPALGSASRAREMCKCGKSKPQRLDVLIVKNSSVTQ
jgi:hypothetical protein